MSKFKELFIDGVVRGHAFQCPACDREHRVFTGVEPGWGFNGDLDNPTLDRVIDIQYKEDGQLRRCVSRIVHGEIAYGPGSTHAGGLNEAELQPLPDAFESYEPPTPAVSEDAAEPESLPPFEPEVAAPAPKPRKSRRRSKD